MPASNSRTVDLLVGAFDLSERRKFTIKNPAGDPVIDLYFKPITRADRKRAQSLAQSDEALDLTTHMLCQVAERACKAVLANAPPLEAFVLLARPEQMGTVAVALDISAAHASTRG